MNISGKTSALTEENIRGYLNTSEDNLNIYVFDEIDSTNSEAKRIIQNGFCNEILVISDTQTAGRGRMGRSFYSPSGKGLYMTYAYKPESELNKNIIVTAAAAVAVVRALRILTAETPEIKWVNDIYVDGKKVCGILSESVTAPDGSLYVIIGIGVNIANDVFPSELSEKAGSIHHSEADRNRFAAAITDELRLLAHSLGDKSFIEDYRSCSFVIGKNILYTSEGKWVEAKAVGITDEGGLVVEDENGLTKVLTSSEISLKVV